MQTEKRLIYLEDAKAALVGWDTDPTDEEIEWTLDQLPEVDAVEVVRCCDCVSCKVILDNVGAGHWHCKKRYGLPEVDPTDFCSGGERRDGE